MYRNYQKGMSLIELMVAMVLALVLTAAVIEVFLSSRQMYRVVDAKARLQENGRFAMQLLMSNLTKTGYTGCSTRSSTLPITNTLNNSSGYLWDFSTGIQGFDATGADTWTPAIDASISSPLSGTDILTLRIVTPPVIRVTKHPSSSADIQVNAGNGLEQFDVVMVTDCLSSAIFQITSANPNTSGSLTHNTGVGTPGNATKDLGRDYSDGEIIKIDTVSFYIRNNDNGVPSLYRRVSNNTDDDELIEGVENMQILYGVDNGVDEMADAYVTAGSVSDWGDVVSVKVSLLLRTLEDNLTVDGNAQSYKFNGSPVTPDDRRLRAVYTRTITLRNRVP